MKSRKAALQLIVFLLILWSSRYTRAAQCYEGTKTFEEVEVESPYCKFTIKYNNSDCEERPWISLEAADDWSNLVIRKPVCYHKRYEVTCFCYGHLCNEESGRKVMPLIEGRSKGEPKEIVCKEGSDESLVCCSELIDASAPLIRIITCYLLNHIAGVKNATGKQTLSDDSGNAFAKSAEENSKSVQKAQGKGGMKVTTYIVVGCAALLVIVVLLSLVIALVVVLKSRKKARASDDDKDSKSDAESLRTPHDYNRLGAVKERGGAHRVTFSTPPNKREWDRSKSSTWETDSVRRGDYSTSEKFDEGQSSSEDDSH